MKTSCRNGIALVLLSSALLAGSGCNKSQDEHATPPVTGNHADVQPANTAEPKLSGEVLSAVESLVAPIALYPDPLLAEVLIAATYPPEIGQAARRLEISTAPEIAAGRNWDASLIRLERLPPVIIMLNEHPQWTIALGDAFLAAPEALLQAIQTLRQRAMQSGLLKDSAAQKVLLKTAPTATQVTASAPAAKRDIIIILPAKAEKIHVPLYDPQTVFSAALAVQPESAANNVAAQPAPDEANAGARSDYYPAYYPVDSISSDSGGAYLAFGAGTVVPGFLTWGNIEWNSGNGYSISHPYGNLPDCGNADDCWIRSGEQGYRYRDASPDSLAQDNDREFSASGRRTVFGVPWHHDPRHRRGVRYGGNVAQQLRELRLPPLAGQRLSGPPQPLLERGFAAPLIVDDTEAEIAAGGYSVAAVYSVFNGINGPEAGDDEKVKRGRTSRNRNKAAMPRNMDGRIADAPRRDAHKPSPKRTAQPEALRALYIEQQRREAALPSAFDAIYDSAGLVARFSRRGAESRANRASPSNAAKISSKRMPDDGD